MTDAPAHDHVFLGQDHAVNERRAWVVIGLTGATTMATTTDTTTRPKPIPTCAAPTCMCWPTH